MEHLARRHERGLLISNGRMEALNLKSLVGHSCCRSSRSKKSLSYVHVE